MVRLLVITSLVVGTLLLVFCFITQQNVFTTEVGQIALIWGLGNALVGYTL
jgi:hypothetical protein